MSALRVEELSKSFGDLRAVRSVSFEIGKGEIFGLVGPDGAGKTTTMRMLAGILEPSAGEAWVAGHHIATEPEKLKEKIGYMSQRFGLYHDLSVAENINFYADIYNVPARGRQEKVDELLAFSGLTPFKRRHAGKLSGGMKQKLGLACALIHKPEVLFLDEPTNGVDPVSRRDFWRILYRLLRDGVTIFVSTAYLDEAERCNRLALLDQGGIIALGTPPEIKELMPGVLAEVRVAEARRAFDLLRRELGVAAVGLYGDRIHLAASGMDDARETLERVLRGSGLRIEATRQIEPSLEDVFVAVLAARGAARAGEDRA